MLEQPSLLLAPWSPGEHRCQTGPNTPLPRWAVLEPATRQLLGLVRCRLRWEGTWFGWLDQPVVEVFETVDESFLFGMRRSWGWSRAWHVADAEGRPVGSLRGPHMHGWQGELLAIIEPAGEGRAGQWYGLDRQELGSFGPADGGVVLQFAPELADGSPFLKMLLLASLLRVE
ncbi:hypothetical protein AYO44_04780 [Planctomycetaceae bacterium SCGC AG-212-F19]|nr:hypothetical protein AYO44_04780 [Planctomycetaceae bacterium SCGC AG-212-F19]